MASSAASGPAHMATTTLKIGGMTCGACVAAVEGGFKDVEGVGNCTVSLMTERAVVIHNPEAISPEQIAEIIDDRGFDAEVLSTDRSSTVGSAQPMRAEDSAESSGLVVTTLSVEGMTCGACTSAIESGFKDEPGVSKFSVSLLSERAVVEHDPDTISPEKIAEIIDDRGFDARVLETKRVAADATQSSHKRASSTSELLTTTTVAIEGMTCGACTSAVESAFKDADGVSQFNISLLAERAVIIHNSDLLSTAEILQHIEDKGFDAKLVSSSTGVVEQAKGTVTSALKIYGLHQDQQSADALKQAIESLPGVSSCDVNLPTSRATVIHNSTKLGLRALAGHIESLGYNALLAESEDNSAQLESLAKTREIQQWKRDFQVSLSFAIPVLLISMIIPMYIKPLDFGSFQILPGLFLGDLMCLILTLPVQFGIGKKFYISAYKSLKHGSPTMDVLVVMGTSAAFFFSCGAMLVSFLDTKHTRPATVFDTSTMLITFNSLGRWLENRAKGQTSKALSQLMSLAPSMATIYADPIAAEKAAEAWEDLLSSEKPTNANTNANANAAEEQVVPTELLQLGDIAILRPGDKVPADGVVLQGSSYVDESMVTGEAVPINKVKGSLLIAGTVNGAGRIDFKVTRAGRDTQLSQIVKLVQEAQTSRAPIQRMADIVAGYFVPIILGLGLLTFIAWMILSHILENPPEIFTHPESGGRFMVCMKLCISVIVFACPCALGLSTPTAVMVGTGIGAQNGVLFKGGAALETATRITHVVFDKTGTLTFGKMAVAKSDLQGNWKAREEQQLFWSLVALAEMGSEHPIGKAIVAAARTELGISSDGMVDGSIGDFQATVGQGVSALVEPNLGNERKRYTVLVGNVDFLTNKGVSLPPSLSVTATANTVSSSRRAKPASNVPAGTTQIHVAINGDFAGSLDLSDTLKPTSRAAVLALGRLGITCSLVTGDTLPTALAVASAVGIPDDNVYASISPSSKREIIQELKAQGASVAMVGDGINDSPALASADVGVALASGTDVAMEAADLVLMRADDMLIVPAALCLARTIFNRIKLNLGWACLYNVVGLPFAMGVGLPAGLVLPPIAAGAAMSLSSVSVVGSSLLLKFWKRPSWLSPENMLSLEEAAKLKALEAEDLGSDSDSDIDAESLRSPAFSGHFHQNPGPSSLRDNPLVRPLHKLWRRTTRALSSGGSKLGGSASGGSRRSARHEDDDDNSQQRGTYVPLRTSAARSGGTPKNVRFAESA